MIRVRQLFVLLSLEFALLVACSKPLDELAPYPCAKDGSCPRGLACIPGVGCAEARLGSLCSDGVTDCSTISQAAVCAAGMCTTPCKTSAECGAGQVCSSPPDVPEGYCVPDCSTGGLCEDGKTCHPLWYSGLSGCFGGDYSVRACAIVEVQTTCDKACGTYLISSGVDCGDGTYCPSVTTCLAGGQCGCIQDQAETCDGSPCSGGNCTDSNWWCAPSGSGNISCDVDLARFTGECVCWNGARRRFSCGSRHTCEQLCQDECDVVRQDCPDPARPKCAEVVSPNGAFQSNVCVPLGGTRQVAEACQRRGNAVSDIGYDDCDRGLYCSLYDILPNAFRCRKHCDASTPCPEGLNCVSTDRVQDPSSSTSLCREACDPFGETGPGCPQGVGCKVGGTSGYCSVIGTTEPGGPCRAGNDCAGNAACTRAGYCAPACDATHECPTGTSCEITPPLTLGVCVLP